MCRQLGFQNAVIAYQNSPRYFGKGSGQIWLDDVYCRGYESSLSSCLHNGWGRHNCDHSDDAGVRCLVRGGENKLLRNW